MVVSLLPFSSSSATCTACVFRPCAEAVLVARASAAMPTATLGSSSPLLYRGAHDRSGYSPNPNPTLNVRTEVMANCTSGATNQDRSVFQYRMPAPTPGVGKNAQPGFPEGVVAAGDRPQEHVGHARVRGAEAALGADPHDVVVVRLPVVERLREDVAGVEAQCRQMFLRQVRATPAWGSPSAHRVRAGCTATWSGCWASAAEDSATMTAATRARYFIVASFAL